MMDDKTQASHWGEADSRHFIDQWRYYVPERELQIDSICALIPPLGGRGLAVDVYWMKAGHAIFGGRKPDEAEVP